MFRGSDVQVFRGSGVQVFRGSGVQVFRGSGVKVFRYQIRSNLQALRYSEVIRCLNVRCLGLQVFMFRCSCSVVHVQVIMFRCSCSGVHVQGAYV